MLPGFLAGFGEVDVDLDFGCVPALFDLLDFVLGRFGVGVDFDCRLAESLLDILRPPLRRRADIVIGFPKCFRDAVSDFPVVGRTSTYALVMLAMGYLTVRVLLRPCSSLPAALRWDMSAARSAGRWAGRKAGVVVWSCGGSLHLERVFGPGPFVHLAVLIDPAFLRSTVLAVPFGGGPRVVTITGRGHGVEP